jgi:hypothetical protein
MTLREVEEIFGKEPEDYEGCAEGAECWWKGDRLDVIVVLDENDKVTNVLVDRTTADTYTRVYSYPPYARRISCRAVRGSYAPRPAADRGGTARGEYAFGERPRNELAYYPPSIGESSLLVYRPPIRRETWRGDDGCVQVVFDANGRVWKKRAWWAR